jgi:hypothetical protein
LVGISQRKKALGMPGNKWENNFKIYISEGTVKGLCWIQLFLDKL